MTENNWAKWGEDLIKTVQNSIDSRDFSNLSRNIGNIVDSAAKNIDESMKASRTRGPYGRNTMYSSERKENHGPSKYSHRYDYDYEQTDTAAGGTKDAAWRTGSSAGSYGRTSGPAGAFSGRYGNVSSNGTANVSNTSRMLPKVYGKTGGTMALGIVSMVFGIMGITGFSIGALTTSMLVIFGDEWMQLGGIISTAILAVLLGGSIFLTVLGNRWIQLVRRFDKYKQIIGKNMYIPVQKLAEKTGKPLVFVIKDLKKMMKKRFFLQGRMDDKETYLMLNEESYRYYLLAQQQYLLREKEKKAKEAEQAAIPEHVRQIIAEGEAFIKKIHASNDAIPGEEISRKISYMEDIVQKIFQRVQQKPELAGDLKKLMSYYLPTTIKLLDAYEELDAQPIQGPNITSSKKEIEDAMDTLNTAFEKMLDDFYQDTAWDISSDISVLHTMLAQEGLTKSDFEVDSKK